jgi:large subunit ribosomal protein L10e
MQITCRPIAFFEIDLRLQEMGIHQFERGVYETMKENAQLEPDGANVKYRPDHGPLTAWYIWRTIFSQQ